MNGCNRILHRRLLGQARLHAHRNRPGHELIHEFVQAGLPAKMLHAGTKPSARTKSAYTQLTSLLQNNEPVVRLSLLRCTDVARNRLPDHRISPCPRSLPAVLNDSVPSLQSIRTIERRRSSEQSHWKSLGNRPCSISSCVGAIEVSWKGKESEVDSNLYGEEQRILNWNIRRELTRRYYGEHRTVLMSAGR